MRNYPDFQIFEFFKEPVTKRLIWADISLRKANDFVALHHRHSGRTAWDGGKFAFQAIHRPSVFGQGGPREETIGVIIVGLPLARALNDGFTAEITRICTLPAPPKNTVSFLVGRAERAWRAHGGERLVTYTLENEGGGSMRAAGFHVAAKVMPKKRGWSSTTRDRAWQDVYAEPKIRWECRL